MPRQLPFEYLDKACLAGTLGPWASFAPTWRLGLRGSLGDAAVAKAVGRLTERYPVLASRVAPLDGTFESARTLAWELEDPPRPERLWSQCDLRSLGMPERIAAEQALADRFLDLSREPPFALTLVRRDDQHSALFVQQHHALADGRAFLELLGELVALLDEAAGGPAAPKPTAFARLPELSVVPEQGLRRAWSFTQGLAASVLQLLRDGLRPMRPMRCNLGQDYSGHNRTHFLLMPLSRLDGWREKAKQKGLSVNALLCSALLLALSRWSTRHGAPPGRTRLLLPVDLRPREGSFRSFANHLSSVLLVSDLSRPPPLLELAASLGQQAQRQTQGRWPLKKLLFETAVARRLSLGRMRKLVFEDRRLFACYSFSNLLALGVPGGGPDGVWRGKGFQVDSLEVTTPCTPPQGANTTLVRYGDRLSFNFNYKDSVLEAALVTDLVATFEQALHEMEAALEEAG